MSENYKELSEHFEDDEIEIGICRFCGQSRQFGVLGGSLGRKELDERATKLCDCSEAKKYTSITERKEKAKKSILEMLGQRFFTSAKILVESLDNLVEGEFTSIMIDTGEGIKAKVSITSKGRIKVSLDESKNLREEI